MTISVRFRHRAAALLLAQLGAVAPLHAEDAPHARLVHCGADSCLRLSGHRASAATVVRAGGEDLAVEGGRSWQVTVPLATARQWLGARNDVLTLTFADPQARARSVGVALPPGALGSRVELASLVVRAQ